MSRAIDDAGSRALAERAYFALCLALGRVLRSARYSKVWMTREGEPQVRKIRRFYAPLLLWMGRPVLRILDTGLLILPQRDWQEREQRLYRSLRGTSIRIEADGTLVLPCLAGAPLATLLEDPALDEARRQRAIELAVVALADFHHHGFTHADAMAENVLVDLGVGVANWFDFETIHDPNRPLAWRRADDLRALLATCLLRTVPGKRGAVLRLILAGYHDEGVIRLLAASFSSVWQRALAFHLAQAGLSFQSYDEIARLMRESTGTPPMRGRSPRTATSVDEGDR